MLTLWESVDKINCEGDGSSGRTLPPLHSPICGPFKVKK